MELQRVVERLKPPDDEHVLRQSKLGEIFAEQHKAVYKEERPLKKKKKKDMLQKAEEKTNEEDESVEFRVRKSDIWVNLEN